MSTDLANHVFQNTCTIDIHHFILYNELMLRTNVYLTEEQERQLRLRAILNKKPKAEVLRNLIDVGLKATSTQGSASAKSLLKLVDLGKKYNTANQPRTSALEEIDKMWRGWGNNDKQK
jgi:hypothetical protein